MKKRDKINKTLSILLRYLILLGLMFTLPLIYKIFTPLTLYPVAGLLKLLFNQVTIYGVIIIINLKTYIQLIPACIAGSAYLLLLLINLSVSMSLRKRIYSILLSFAILLVLNILRILFLSILYYNKIPFFDFTHLFFWYVLSIVFVIGIWFFIVKIFHIKEIPVYSDMKYLIKGIKKN